MAFRISGNLGDKKPFLQMAGELVSGGVAVIAAMTFPAALAAKAA